jgi:hypothetical protein
MRSLLAHTVDRPFEEVPRRSESHLSKISRMYEESGARFRAPLSLALLSVAFQEYPSWLRSSVKVFMYDRLVLDLLGAGLVLAALLAVWARTSRLAIAIFIVIAAISILPDWMAIANHTYLALWSIPVAILFREWWRSDLYAFYLRLTIGIVMLAAFSQKILAGTYVDGSYIAWLSINGSPTERLFSFLCDNASPDPCVYYRAISIFILAWQLCVGILLLLGLNSLVFLAIEVGFLLGAGVYADEMNFQILNIALLCIIFRYGMPLWLLAVCIALLVMDLYGISYFVGMVVNRAA